MFSNYARNFNFTTDHGSVFVFERKVLRYFFKMNDHSQSPVLIQNSIWCRICSLQICQTHNKLMHISELSLLILYSRVVKYFMYLYACSLYWYLWAKPKQAIFHYHYYYETPSGPFRFDLHFHENGIGGVPEFLPPAGREQQLDLGPAALGQRHLEGSLLGQRELAEDLALLRPRVVQDVQQLMGGRVMHTR